MNEERGNNGNTILLTVIGVATLLVALVGATFAYFSANVTGQASESMLVTTAVVAGLNLQGTNGINLTNMMPGDSDDSTFTVSNPSKVTTSDGSSQDNKAVMAYDLKLVVEQNSFVKTAENGVTDSSSELDDQLRLLVGTGNLTAGSVEGKTNPNISKVEFASATGTDSLTLNSTSTSGSEYESGKYKGYYNLTDSSSVSAGKNYTVVSNQILGAGGSMVYNVKLYFVDTTVAQNNNQGQTFKAHFEIANVKSVNASTITETTSP